MNKTDAEKINEAQQHLTMARIVLNRMSNEGKSELTNRLGADVEKFINELMESGDKLGNIYTDWSRE